MPSPRRRRLLIAISTSLVFLAGCPGPTAPTGSPKRGGGVTTAAAGPAGGPASAAPATSGTQILTNGLGNGPAPKASGEPGAAAAAAGIDTQKFLIGRVFVPLGIVSNNGANVIGQNGANVIGQNGANIVSNNGGSVIGQNGANVIGQNGANVVGQNGANVVGQNGANVVGQNGANVIGQNGANVIGQNGANVIGQNGANIVSNNGGNIVSNNGAGIISNNGGSLGQRPLAYATVKLTDASGNVKIGKNGKPLEAVADAWGQFLVPREEVDANSVIKVSSPHINGELKAFVAKNAETPEKELSVDMVSTISSTYILEKYVDGKQEVLEKLTPTIEAEARQDLVAALEGKADEVFNSTSTDALLSTVDRFIDGVEEVRDVFDRIEKLLILAGIVNDGDGMPALQVPFKKVNGLMATENGLYVFTLADHRLRLVDNSGTLRNVILPDSWPYPELKGRASNDEYVGMVYREGWLYFSDYYANRIVRAKDGVIETVVGTGVVGNSPDGTSAKNCLISSPSGISIDKFGNLYFVDAGNSLIRKVSIEGVVTTVVGGGDRLSATSPILGRELALYRPFWIGNNTEGDLFWTEEGRDRIRRMKVNGGLCEEYISGVDARASVMVGDVIYLLNGSGELLKVSNKVSQILKLKNVSGAEFETSSLGRPLALGYANNRLHVQFVDGTIRAINLDRMEVLPPLAGLSRATSVSMLAGAQRMDINRRGDIVIADRLAKRVHVQRVGSALETVAGNGESGFVDSSNSPTTVPIGTVESVVWDGDDAAIFVCGGESPCVKRVWIGHSLETIIGTGSRDRGKDKSGQAREISLDQPAEIVRLADGRIVFVEREGEMFQLTDSGRVEHFNEWNTGKWWEILFPGNISYSRGSYLMVNQYNDSVISIRNGTVAEVFERSRFLPALGIGGIRAAAVDSNENLYVGTKTMIVRLDSRKKVAEIFAGPGGRYLNQDSRDESISSLQEIAISPAGDLIILESDQVKLVPKNAIDSF